MTISIVLCISRVNKVNFTRQAVVRQILVSVKHYVDQLSLLSYCKLIGRWLSCL